MTNSKTKTRDQGNSKFLQRIAGKKALGPPPTPRPIIGEHPVRTLLRENADEIEEIKSEATVQAETPVSITNSSNVPQQTVRVPRITEEPSASNASVVEHLKSSAGGVGRVLVEPDQKLQAGSTEKSDTSKGTE